MSRMKGSILVACVVAFFAMTLSVRAHGAGELPSWNDGSVKRAIVGFVQATTREGSPTFVAPKDRIAVFDEDGTLWTELPLLTEGAFVIDLIRELAPRHPEWRTQQPYAAVMERGPEALRGMTKHDIAALIAATHAGMSTEDFARIVEQWLATARHPRFHRPYTECTYRPMLELLGYLRQSGYSIYIVSGGGTDFMRVFAERVYGVPTANVIGSVGKKSFVIRDGRAELMKLPELTSIDDGPGKPINIDLHVGRRPIFAFGNADGDLQMLQYTTMGPGPHFAALVHHDDAAREYAYDRDAPSWGRLDKALDAAPAAGWTLVSMKRDWATIFP
jgi:phosphoserine phosphatase